MEIGINMRNLILLMFLIFSINLYGGTCSSISRTDFVDGNILSASDLNTQFGTAYSAVNAADGGCITDGTLELGALGTSEFSPQLKGIRKGCIVKETATSSFEISACLATVNGKNVDKTATTSVTYANLDTGSMATSTTYYIFINSSSTGSTLTPKISATAPDALGYNATNDLLLARFQTSYDSTNVRNGSVYQFDGSAYTSNKTIETFIIDASDGSIDFSNGGYIDYCTKTGTGSFLCYGKESYIDNTVTPLISPVCIGSSLATAIIAANVAVVGVDVGDYHAYSVVSRKTADYDPVDSDFVLTCNIVLK